MIRQEIKNLIEKAIKELQKEWGSPELEISNIKLEEPEKESYGDYATAAAFDIARQIKKNPLDTARDIELHFDDDIKKFTERIEVYKPGFINFFLSKEYLQKQVGQILKEKEDFGKSKIGRGQRVNVEFISANPTGPLHIGNARGGFCGDVLANVLEKSGYEVFREYYVNDMGRQILFLENSLNNIEPSYKNQYIDDLKAKGEKDVKKAIKYIVDKIKETTERMGIKFDEWVYESSLEKGRKEVLNFLEKKNLIYEKEGATWFRSTGFGDDKDRVLRRAEEKTIYREETYILSDIAYLNNKFRRGFDYLIIFLGAEHHGYVPRLKAATEALDYDKNKLRPIIMQLVRLVEKGKEMKMSKRSGTYITIDELIGEVGVDVSRFLFLMRSFGSHLLFDLDLAKEQSEKNPVYYIQYAYARISSILRKAPKYQTRNTKYDLLNQDGELSLIKQLIRLPEIIEDTAKDYQIQRIPQYALDLVTTFHKFYEQCRVISENQELTQARLMLVLAARIVLKNTLDLMAISAPEKM